MASIFTLDFNLENASLYWKSVTNYVIMLLFKAFRQFCPPAAMRRWRGSCRSIATRFVLVGRWAIGRTASRAPVGWPAIRYVCGPFLKRRLSDAEKVVFRLEKWPAA